MKSILPLLLATTLTGDLPAQSAPSTFSAALFTERESEDVFRTGRNQYGNAYELEFSPLRRTGLEVGWWSDTSAFRPSLEFASGHALQGSHSHASVHLEWGTKGPFIVQGGILLINQTHGGRSNAGYGGRIQLGWLFNNRVAVLAYAGLTSLFQDQTPQSDWLDLPGAFTGFKVAVRF